MRNHIQPNEAILSLYYSYRKTAGGRDHWGPKTMKVRTSQLRQFADWMAPTPIAEATEDHLLRWHASIMSAGYAIETVASATSAVHGLYRWMTTRARPRLRDDDPSVLLDRPAVPAGVPRPMPTHLYDLALACSLSDPEMYLWLGLMGCCGLRCCEVAWMQTHDVEERPDGSGLLHVLGKGGKRRTVPAGTNLIQTLRPFLSGRGPVFTNQSGRAYNPDRVSQRTNRFLQRIGIHETAHQMRHLFGTDYHALDPDLYRQAKIMGHSSVDTTQRYTAISPSEAAQYVEAMTRRRMSHGGTRHGHGEQRGAA